MAPDTAWWDRQVYAVTLAPQDFLWFSSYDALGISSTEAVIHNFALAYALNRFERAIAWDTLPRYEEDLAEMQYYCTPARAREVVRIGITYNAVDERSQRTDSEQTINTPMLGQRRVIVPFLRRGPRAEPVEFSFYLFAPRGAVLPRLIQLDKKRAPVRLDYRLLAGGRLVRRTDTPTHLVNPLDVRSTVRAFWPISVPPNLVLDSATIEDDWFFIAGRDIVHVPIRLSERSPSA
jgi:CRISPR-associated protein Csc1